MDDSQGNARGKNEKGRGTGSLKAERMFANLKG